MNPSRSLLRAKLVSFVVIVTVALGVGLTTAIFSVVDGVLLKPLPYPQSERLVWMGESTGSANGISVTWPNFVNWREGNHSFEQLAAFQFVQATLTGRGEARSLRGLSVTHEYLPLLGVQPLLGRLLDARDDRPGGPAAIVLNHRFWSGALGADPSVVGTTLSLDGRPHDVIGVAAPVWEARPADYYQALGRVAGSTTDRAQHGSIRALGRLEPGVTLASARGDLDGIMRQLAGSDPGPENEHRAYLEILSERTTGPARATLLALMGAAGLVLLIACANVASLLLARGTTRTTEFAVRTALGAGRGRLARQLLVENLVLAGVGGAAGIVLAYWARAALVALAPLDIPRLAETAIDWPVLLFALAVSLATGLLFGMAPMIAAVRVDVTSALKAGGRAVTAGAARQYTRSLLVIGEIALTFVLVFGASLLLRSLMAAQHANPGVDAARLLSLELRLPASYRGADAIGAFYDRLGDAARAIPGVTSVSGVRCPPGTGGCGDWFYSVPGQRVPARNEVPIALTNAAEPGYFKTMGVVVRQGREFSRADGAGGRSSRARQRDAGPDAGGPRESAVGHQIKLGGPYIDGPLARGRRGRRGHQAGRPGLAGAAGDLPATRAAARRRPRADDPDGWRPGRPDPAGPRARARGSIRTCPCSGSAPSNAASTRAWPVAGSARRCWPASRGSQWSSPRRYLRSAELLGQRARTRDRHSPGARRPAGAIVRWTSAQALRLRARDALGAAGAWVVARGLEDLVFGIRRAALRRCCGGRGRDVHRGAGRGDPFLARGARRCRRSASPVTE